MKVMVTGATGFIGNYIVERLIKINEIEIITTAIEKIEDVENQNIIRHTTYISCDLNEKKENFYKYFKEPDLLIHLSWEGLPNYQELYHFEKNLFSNYNFLKNMVLNGLKDVNVIGTCLEYGMKSGKLSENIATNPGNPYSLGKDTLRRFLEELKKKFDYSLKWIRLFYIYGKGQGFNSILQQLDRALENDDKDFNMSGGEQLRDYLPVEKVAEYIIKISLQNKINGIINCCSGKPISIKKLVEDHLKKRNKKIRLNLGYYPYPDHEPMEFWGDPTKLNLIKKKRKDRFQ